MASVEEKSVKEQRKTKKLWSNKNCMANFWNKRFWSKSSKILAKKIKRINNRKKVYFLTIKSEKILHKNCVNLLFKNLHLRKTKISTNMKNALKIFCHSLKYSNTWMPEKSMGRKKQYSPLERRPLGCAEYVSWPHMCAYSNFGRVV